MMSYERLDVYQCSIKFRMSAHGICNDLPRGHSSLADQIRRASIEIPLSLDKGAGKRTKADCRRFFFIARVSAMECAAAVDVCRALELIGNDRASEAKTLFHRTLAMLIRLGRLPDQVRARPPAHDALTSTLSPTLTPDLDVNDPQPLD